MSSSGSSWRSLLLRIGDKCPEYGGSGEYKEHIDTCYSAFLREWENCKEDIFELLLQCAEQLPHKIPFYGLLVGLINLENENFAKRVVDTTHSRLQDALHSGNSNKIRILLRFLTVLVCGNVIQPASLVAIFETLLSSAATTMDEDTGNPSWQSRADFYVTRILSSLPWGGAELIEKIYIVGGNILDDQREEGNIFTVPSNKHAEFKMFLDPLVAKTVVESNLDITLFPLKAQRKVTSFPAILKTLELFYKTRESILAHRLLSLLQRLQKNHWLYHHVDLFQGEILGAVQLHLNPVM